ncbi:MAG: polysaccharide pyruvyl transferase family protein [Chloroflexi bacterium]|nr:polysaccharide pyruvyl transferase family protein [Chloroflexota bacterium]
MNSELLLQVLSSLGGKPVFFEPVGGNHGDTLIEMGSRHLLAKLGIIPVQDPAAAAAIIINGSGSVGVELWSPGLSGLKYYLQAFPHTLLIVLPSSFYFRGPYFPDLFAARTGPAYVFARDKYSFDLIQNQPYVSDVRVGIGNDMAFELGDSDFLRTLLSKCSEKHVLLVERFDQEATTAATRQLNIPQRFKAFFPPPMQHFLKKIIHHRRTGASTFSPLALQRLYHEFPQFMGLPVLVEDISSPVGFAFAQFTQAIAEAAVVITTRLHVAILAALLRKPVFIQSGPGPYQKLRGVWEYTMSEMVNVHLW